MEYTIEPQAFERPNQYSEYVSSLRLRHMLPLKFGYIGQAAYAHDLLMRSQEYHVASVEDLLLRNLLVSEVLSLSQFQSGINLLDVGPGNGVKAVGLLDVLRQKTENVFYFALDYSEELADIALQNISQSIPWLRQISRHVVDFEEHDFREVVDQAYAQTGASNLVAIIGHTLGNPYDRLRSLANIRDSIRREDMLLVGVELFHPSKIDDVLANYDNEPCRRALFNLLTFIGLADDDGMIEITFNEARCNVEAHYRFSRDIRVRVPNSDPLVFVTGERVLIFQSHRFETNELHDLFALAGLSVEAELIDSDTSHIVVALKSTNIL